MPRKWLLMTRTLTAILLTAAVASSDKVIWNPPSPTTAHTGLSGQPSLAPTAAGKPKPMEFLAPSAGGTYCDATIGLGGHAAAILERSSPNGRLVGIDRDRDAIERARAHLATYGDRVTLAHAPFGSLLSALESVGAPLVDGCLVDLGVSSMQLDRAERGFSFRHSGPLDMRRSE